MSLQSQALIRVTVEVAGGEALMDQFLNLPRRMEQKIARSALHDGGALMLPAVRSGIRSRTGLLSRSTRLRFGKRDRPGRFSVLISAWSTAGTFAKARTKSGRHAEASAVLARHAKSDKYAVFYGYFVEKGHGGPRPAPPHPFAAPGFDATVDQTADVIEERLVEGINEAV